MAGDERKQDPGPEATRSGDDGERERVTPPESPETTPPPVSDVPVCDLCGSIMLERHCRLVCTQCGYQRDCSDP